MLGPSWGMLGVCWGVLKVWRGVREVEGVAATVERGWRCTECCFLQRFRKGFGVGVEVNGAVGWPGEKVWLQDVLLFAMVLHRLLMSG